MYRHYNLLPSTYGKIFEYFRYDKKRIKMATIYKCVVKISHLEYNGSILEVSSNEIF